MGGGGVGGGGRPPGKRVYSPALRRRRWNSVSGALCPRRSTSLRTALKASIVRAFPDLLVDGDTGGREEGGGAGG